eukprot:snap_masked-scaffold885_size84862-processed-gene-0.1 protein:Tk07026 transcript:snap_masked-scaffold885_size84862-processed-gene-0.1-mRNA-1 annotation:"histone-lysine n-methyltransferase setmar"
MKREDVTAYLDGVFRTISIVDFVDAFHAWKRRWEKCIQIEGGYASHIWSHQVKDHHKQKLQRLNRLAAQTMAGFRRTTPTEGLELLLGLEPMDILVHKISTTTGFKESSTSNGMG